MCLANVSSEEYAGFPALIVRVCPERATPSVVPRPAQTHPAHAEPQPFTTFGYNTRFSFGRSVHDLPRVSQVQKRVGKTSSVPNCTLAFVECRIARENAKKEKI